MSDLFTERVSWFIYDCVQWGSSLKIVVWGQLALRSVTIRVYHNNNEKPGYFDILLFILFRLKLCSRFLFILSFANAFKNTIFYVTLSYWFRLQYRALYFIDSSYTLRPTRFCLLQINDNITLCCIKYALKHTKLHSLIIKAADLTHSLSVFDNSYDLPVSSRGLLSLHQLLHH